MRQALTGEPITVTGDGSQTRSVCYVDDLIEGALRLLLSDLSGPVNIGSPHELTILELAQLVRDVVGSESGIEFIERPQDDPTVRQPDIAHFVFLCVGTPPSASGLPDLAQVEGAVRSLAPYLRANSVIINKSTVPVGADNWVRHNARGGLARGPAVDVPALDILRRLLAADSVVSAYDPIVKKLPAA